MGLKVSVIPFNSNVQSVMHNTNIVGLKTIMFIFMDTIFILLDRDIETIIQDKILVILTLRSSRAQYCSCASKWMGCHQIES